MSELTFRDKLPQYRRQYGAMRSKRARGALLDRLIEEYQCERKYLIKLLRGKRNYRARRGRGSTYSESSKALVLKVWIACGQPCSKYMKAQMSKSLKDYQELHGVFPEKELREMQKMSFSTLERVFARTSNIRCGAHRNKHSGKTWIKSLIHEEPGKASEDGGTGILQMDTVALCGGNMAESFFFIATLTDAQTQWVEIAPTWNRGAYYTKEALEEMMKRLPIKVRHVHPDNGSEFINKLFVNYLWEEHPEIQISRSRPNMKNDNCRIEQKNGSVVREYFQDIRFDRFKDREELQEICRDVALYTNLFKATKKLVSKVKRPGKGGKYRFRYDKPQTPLERLQAVEPENQNVGKLVDVYENTNQILLLQSINRRINRLVRQMRISRDENKKQEKESPIQDKTLVGCPCI